MFYGPLAVCAKATADYGLMTLPDKVLRLRFATVNDVHAEAYTIFLVLLISAVSAAAPLPTYRTAGARMAEPAAPRP